MPFAELMNDEVTIVKQTGERFGPFMAVVQRNKIITDEASIPIEEGDFVERLLPNGLTERYCILDTGFQAGFGGIPPHYQMSVEKTTAIPRRAAAGTTTVYNIGANSRYTVNSVDSSTNIVQASPSELFDRMREAVVAGVGAAREREKLLARIAELQSAADRRTFAERYGRLVESGAAHITILTPFLPALAQLLESLG
jgi:hypothetical protein